MGFARGSKTRDLRRGWAGFHSGAVDTWNSCRCVGGWIRSREAWRSAQADRRGTAHVGDVCTARLRERVAKLQSQVQRMKVLAWVVEAAPGQLIPLTDLDARPLRSLPSPRTVAICRPTAIAPPDRCRAPAPRARTADPVPE